uniref:cell growth regulator with RING finger domain protein 1 isoform X1 n=2 Tax=Doryrhamphus excisus TaxID=161450 RepID=UPI0025ADAA59|nr:cell growth regulator with RING finger domain protein 1 isoform X1 [Doryrhamphus excisus]
MAGVFLVTLYEYSPLFYISVVSLCFLVTAAMVLGWFGFDVPVILRSSDDTEFLPTPEKQMVQVSNPFSLVMGSGRASVADGVKLKPCCLEPCVLSCFWGCEVSALQRALHAAQGGSRLGTPQHFQEALHPFYLHKQSFYVGSEDGEERHTCIPADLGITDLGPLPRQSYPLVAVLTLAQQEARDSYNFVANVTVVHVPDHKHKMSARILFQFLLTSQGNMYELKPLFMSADSGVNSDLDLPGAEEASRVPEDEDWRGGRVRDCVVCQNACINRVLLPCRHACVCNSCGSRFQHCPICRAFIVESFALTL